MAGVRVGIRACTQPMTKMHRSVVSKDVLGSHPWKTPVSDLAR